MKKLVLSITVLGMLLVFGNKVFSQTADPMKKLKTHLNEVVSDVQETEAPDQKREILNAELTDLITTIEKVEGMERVPEEDISKLKAIRGDLQNKKDELNGENGYTRVPANQLNNYANFVQQDFEQADRVVTLSLTTVLLVVIILLLL